MKFSKTNTLIITALVTPFISNGDVDYDSLAHLIKRQLAEKVDGLVVLGTTAESATLDTIEKTKILQFVRQHVPDSVPLIAGVGTNSTRHTITQHLEAKALGYQASLVVTPYYNNPNSAAIYAHYQAINDSCDLPFILYHVPSRTGSKITLSTAEAILNLSHCCGLKDASGELAWAQLMKHHTGFFFSGDDLTTPVYHQIGGHGVISVLANFSPKQMLDYLMTNDQKLRELIDALGCDTNPVPIKHLLHQVGIIAEPTVRAPLQSLAENDQRRLSDMYHALLSCSS